MSEEEKNELRRKNNESQKRRREKKKIAMLENPFSDSMTENPSLFKEEPFETDCEYEDRSYDETFIGLNEIKNEVMDDIKEESCFTDDPLNVGAALTKEKK